MESISEAELVATISEKHFIKANRQIAKPFESEASVHYSVRFVYSGGLVSGMFYCEYRYDKDVFLSPGGLEIKDIPKRYAVVWIDDGTNGYIFERNDEGENSELTICTRETARSWLGGSAFDLSVYLGPRFLIPLHHPLVLTGQIRVPQGIVVRKVETDEGHELVELEGSSELPIRGAPSRVLRSSYVFDTSRQFILVRTLVSSSGFGAGREETRIEYANGPSGFLVRSRIQVTEFDEKNAYLVTRDIRLTFLSVGTPIDPNSFSPNRLKIPRGTLVRDERGGGMAMSYIYGVPEEAKEGIDDLNLRPEDNDR